MIVEKLEDTLQGGFGGLYGEVVTEDSYHLGQLKFTPDFFIDLGSNVGVCTRYARELFPNAFIISVEPDPENFEHMLKFTKKDDKMIFVNKAIGKGDVWKCAGAPNGAHETYLTSGPGNPEEQMAEDYRMDKTDVESIMLDELFYKYCIITNGHIVLKMDIEGNETVIFNDPASMEVLKRMDYICGEFHNQALTGDLTQGVKDVTEKAMQELSETHDIERDHIYFYAEKK